MAKSKRSAAAAPPAPAPAAAVAPPAPTKRAPAPTAPSSPPPPFPLAHYLSRVSMQTGAILFTLIQAANSNSSLKISSPGAAVAVLVADPVSVLLVAVAGLGFVQAWFGNWARNTRRTAMGLDKKDPTEAVAVEKKGFWGAWNEMSKDALKGKAPHRNFAAKGGKPVFNLDFSFLGPASLVTLAGAGVLHVLAVLLGAPLVTRCLETFLLSCLVAVLAIGPVAVAVGPTERFVWLRMFSSMSPANDVEFALVAPAIGTLVGCWAGAIPIPLDWDRPWQAWPTTCVVGAVLGHVLGSLASVVWCSIRAMNASAVAAAQTVKAK